MRRRTEFRVIIGCLLWIGCLSYLFVFVRGITSSAEGTATSITNYLTTRPAIVEIHFERPRTIRVGDPVFANIDGVPELIGRIQQVKSKECTNRHFEYTDVAFIELTIPRDSINEKDWFTFHETPNDIGWVIETMLPDSTRERIAELITEAYRDNHKAIAEAFEPIIRDTIRDTLSVVGEDMRAALKKRETEIEKLGQRFKSDLVDEKIVPLIRKEIWPIVQEESEDLVKDIGRDLWKEVSIWRFTWRAIYDATPMTGSNLTGREFRRFIDEKATPIIEDYVPEIVDVQQRILSRVSKNKKVESELGQAFRSIINDAEVQSMIREIGQEIFVGNDRLRLAIEKHWKSPAALAAMDEANRRLDPTVVEIGALMFGAIDDEIAPDFSAVLRNRIMRKDTRWLRLERGSISNSIEPEAVIPVADGSGHDTYPGRIRDSIRREFDYLEDIEDEAGSSDHEGSGQ